MEVKFAPASRSHSFLKLAVIGPSGSGKTFSSLLLASGIGKKIAVLDTENGSASLYSDKFKFDVLNMNPPYIIKKYESAFKAAEEAGYDVLVVDSLSHAWAGEGGLLQRKEALDSKGGNTFTNWRTITEEHERLKSAILNAKMHVVCTMRSKQDYVLEINDKGKSSPKKVGTAPIQRDGMEYEFTVVFDIAIDHNFHVSKDRTGLFDGRIEVMSQAHGRELLAWVSCEAPNDQASNG